MNKDIFKDFMDYFKILIRVTISTLLETVVICLVIVPFTYLLFCILLTVIKGI